MATSLLPIHMARYTYTYGHFPLCFSLKSGPVAFEPWKSGKFLFSGFTRFFSTGYAANFYFSLKSGSMAFVHWKSKHFPLSGTTRFITQVLRTTITSTMLHSDEVACAQCVGLVTQDKLHPCNCCTVDIFSELKKSIDFPPAVKKIIN